MNLVQTVLNLDRTWPCRRTRWWVLAVPQSLPLWSIPDLPFDRSMRQVGHLLPIWPSWPVEEEQELLLTDYELGMLQDPTLGEDMRWLAMDGPCPCILHAYSNFARPCPCGCRSSPLSLSRLQRAGLRGFFALSHHFQKPRWLHPKEAAILCAMDPFTTLASHLRGALSQIGQCASPLQALWIGSHLLVAMGKQDFAPVDSLHLFKMALLRQAHGIMPQMPQLDVVDTQVMTDQGSMSLRMSADCTAQQLCRAERALQGLDHRVRLYDHFGQLSIAFPMERRKAAFTWR